MYKSLLLFYKMYREKLLGPNILYRVPDKPTLRKRRKQKCRPQPSDTKKAKENGVYDGLFAKTHLLFLGKSPNGFFADLYAE